MNNEQLRYLWDCYQVIHISNGGPARDRLPYTDAFEIICERFNSRFSTTVSRSRIWAALSDLDKDLARRLEVGCTN